MDLQLVKMGPEYREMAEDMLREWKASGEACLLYTSPSPRDTR